MRLCVEIDEHLIDSVAMAYLEPDFQERHAADGDETRTLQAIVSRSSGATNVQVIYGMKK